MTPASIIRWYCSMVIRTGEDMMLTWYRSTSPRVERIDLGVVREGLLRQLDERRPDGVEVFDGAVDVLAEVVLQDEFDLVAAEAEDDVERVHAAAESVGDGGGELAALGHVEQVRAVAGQDVGEASGVGGVHDGAAGGDRVF